MRVVQKTVMKHFQTIYVSIFLLGMCMSVQIEGTPIDWKDDQFHLMSNGEEKFQIRLNILN